MKLTGKGIQKSSSIKISLSLYKLKTSITPNPKPITLDNKSIRIANKNQIPLMI